MSPSFETPAITEEPYIDVPPSRSHELWNVAKLFIGRTALALSLATGLVAIEAIVAPTAAVADDGGYPDASAPCVANNNNQTQGKGYWCDQYQWGYYTRNGQGKITGNVQNSSRGYGYRNCTDYTAWRIPTLIKKAVPKGWGKAKDWDDNAKSAGYQVDTTPEPGDIAVWNSGSYGHVEVVESVNTNGTVNTSGYNKHQDGTYGTQSSVTADAYIDLNGPNKGLGDQDLNPVASPPLHTLTNRYYLNNSFDATHDLLTTYGDPEIPALKGDWDGDGIDTLAVRYGNVYYFNNSFDAAADFTEAYGDPTYEAYAGDWDGDGRDSLVVRSGNTFYFDNNFDRLTDFTESFGNPGDTVVVGDWDGDGSDTVGIRQGNTILLDYNTDGIPDNTWHYGDPGLALLAGDWNGDGHDTLGVRYGNTYYLDNNFDSQADIITSYGDSDDQPLAGDWDGDGVDTVGVREVRVG